MNLDKGNSGDYRLENTNLSKASAILTIIQIVVSVLLAHMPLGIIRDFPYIWLSLLLAIISKCKYNDKLSLRMIVIDVVIILLSMIWGIVMMILGVWMLGEFFNACGGYR